MASVTLRRLVAGINTGVSVVSDAGAASADHYILKTSSVSRGVFDVSERKAVTDSGEISRLACPVESGTLLVSRMNTPELVGACGYVAASQPDTFLPDRLWLVSFHADKCCPRYVYWWTTTDHYRSQIKSVCSGTSQSMQNISQEQFLGLTLPAPALTTQTAIANYLDAKTAAIDALIAKKELLLEELRKYQDSRLSEILASRTNNARRLKYMATVLPGQSPSSSDVHSEGTIPFIQGCAQFGPNNPNPTEFCEVSARVAQPMDVLISVRAPVGQLNVANCKIGLGRGVAAVRAKNQNNARFLFWALYSAKARLRSVAEGTTFEAVTASDIENLLLPTADLSTQIDIAAQLDELSARVSKAIRTAQVTIADLKAYRAALISEAVTGKISV